MGRKWVAPPDGWITLRDVAIVNGLAHYPRLVARLCALPGHARLLVRRYRGRACLRYRELPELQARIDAWLAGPKWSHFARRRARRRRVAPAPARPPSARIRGRWPYHLRPRDLAENLKFLAIARPGLPA